MPCANCRRPALLHCDRCTTNYCSSRCQIEAWKGGHKMVCKELALQARRGGESNKSSDTAGLTLVNFKTKQFTIRSHHSMSGMFTPPTSPDKVLPCLPNLPFLPEQNVGVFSFDHDYTATNNLALTKNNSIVTATDKVCGGSTPVALGSSVMTKGIHRWVLHIINAGGVSVGVAARRHYPVIPCSCEWSAQKFDFRNYDAFAHDGSYAWNYRGTNTCIYKSDLGAQPMWSDSPLHDGEMLRFTLDFEQSTHPVLFLERDDGQAYCFETNVINQPLSVFVRFISPGSSVEILPYE